ncbi:ABC transporter ATP-binding protein [Microbacterium halotolerans]|uniref:ABC transporter ATP-binding protein n=1 Tax=Microbacterium halotolerans TaxID=246613 RepID=UPI000E6AB8D9|nr:ABC transporter ATP-binding protein [Microbacterium halotolerans]
MAKQKRRPAQRQTVSSRSEGTAWHIRVAADEHILEVDDLTIATTAAETVVVDGVNLDLKAAEILALVGESGSGKTTVGLAILGHIRRGLTHTGGTVALHASHSEEPAEMMTLDESSRRRLRGTRVSYIPQDPALSLNPGIRVGKQIREVLDIHGYGSSEAERVERVRSVLREVGLPDDDAYLKRWPHQLSGGQQQRIGIAMAFAMYPDVIVLDEPTTGLDVTTQEQVLETIREMTVNNRVAGLYITHDLAVVSEIADRVAVMLRGEIVEVGATAELLRQPQHDYTRRLLSAVPDLAGRNQIGRLTTTDARTSEFLTGELPVVTPTDAADVISRPASPAAADAPAVALTVRDLGLTYGETQVLRGIDLEVNAGECTLLLGQSGSGKTTLARSISGILSSYTGSVKYRGEELAKSTRDRTPEQRKQIQYIFQSPFSSLNPRRTLGQSLTVPLEMSGDLSAHGRRERVRDALDAVQLGRQFYDRRPGDLSGGERQRAAIARALVNMPSVLVCDEITSALDVSVQASIISLLHTLQAERGLAMLFVTHNIALARHIASRVAVLNRGAIVDDGPVDDVLDNPRHAYTKELLANVPTL